jgi:glutathionylspermidine synthase
VKKPLLSREGANVTIVKDGEAKLVNDYGYGKEGYVYQKYSPIPTFNGNYPVIGSWVVGGRACGMGIREDNNEVTGNTSRFVPHFFDAE